VFFEHPELRRELIGWLHWTPKNLTASP
jgi:hypothetical protein